MFNLELEDFKKKNKISDDDWERSECDWSVLKSIANDFLESKELLNQSAEFFAKVIQTFPGIHSVRWRVKDVEHLLEKIVRKKARNEKKYRNISRENYFSIITDLVGVRALHLFKDEYIEIDRNIRANWKCVEVPIIYFREGDEIIQLDSSQKKYFKIKKHPAGYRSVHYVVANAPLKREVRAEVQIRTIFEEGWSEIDHKIRYPNFSDNDLIKYFLSIFNRLSGSADEMGTFIKDLSAAFNSIDMEREESKKIVEQVMREKNEAVASMSELTAELSRIQGVRKEDLVKIRRLQAAAETIERSNNKIFDAALGIDAARKGMATQSSFPSGLHEVLKNVNLTPAERLKKQLAESMSPTERLKKQLLESMSPIERFKKELSESMSPAERLRKQLSAPILSSEKLKE